MTKMHHKTLKFLVFSAFMLCIYAQTFVTTTRQIFNPTIDTKLRFRYNFSDPTIVLGAIMSTTDQRANDTFFFDPANPAKAARILCTVRVTPDNNTYGVATIPPQALNDPETNVSVHYFRMSANNTGAPNYAIAGSRTLKTADFPKIGDDFEKIDTTALSALSDNLDFLTLIYTTLIYHDSTVDLTCQYTIDYTGFVRSLYFNDDPRGQWGVEQDDIKSRQNYTYGPVHLNAQEMVQLTVIGYRLNIASFQIVNCQDPSGQAVTPNLTYYRPGNRITTPQGITYNRQTTTCQTSADRCVSNVYSVDCSFNFYRSNDLCRGLCPTTELTVTGYDDCSAFTYNQIRRGYKTIAETASSANTVFSFYIDLQQGSQVLTIFWPSESNIMTPTTFWFPGGAYMMSKAVYTLHTVPENGVLDYSIALKLLQSPQVAADAQRQMQYSHYEVFTDPDRTLMTVSYNAEPTTQAQMQNPRSFSYAPHDKLLRLNPDTFIYVTTYVYCYEACTISVLSSGYVEGYQDTRTFLFAMNYGPVAWSYTVPATFTGLTSFTFQVQNSTDFQFNVVSRNYTIFSHGFPISMQSLTLSQSTNSVVDATSDACVNGEGDVCFSCNAGYFLNEVTGQCVTTCPTGYYTYTPDRKCFRSECRDHTLEIDNMQCNPRCNEDERFYIDGQGCSGECFKGCPLCSNNTGVCIVCAYKDPISFVSQCSHCPPGTIFDNEADACVDNTALSISIMGPAQVSSCADLILTASMDPVEELYLSPLALNWTVSTTSGVDLFDLQDFLVNETRKEVIIPSNLLTVNGEYTFTVSYSNVFDRVKTATKTVTVVRSALPSVRIDGGASQALYHYNDNVLKARIAYSEDCFGLTDAVQASWRQTSGPSVDLSSDMSSPFWLSLAKCSLTPGTTYGFEVSVWREGNTNDVATAATEFRIPPVNYTVEIVNGNREFPYNANIDLQTMMTYKVGDCGYVDDGSRIQYQWTCEKKPTGTEDIAYDACPDPRSLFNVAGTSSLLRIPTSYFTQGDTLRIGVTALKGEDSTYTSVELNITSSTTLPIAMTCVNCALESYPEVLLFQGSVPNDAISGLTYGWSVNPKLPSTAFNIQYKVTKNNVLEGKDFMQVHVSAQSNDQSVKGYLQVPVDPAPKGGVLTVSPDFGQSLATYFHIAASGWQDNDAPLTYEFFYKFADGPEYRLTDKQKYPYIYTMLPGSATTSEMTIRVAVSDSLGAQGSAQAVIGVTSRGENIMDDLRTFRSNFGAITMRGDPSVTKADSIEMLKALSFMGREMNSFENLNSSFQEGYLTPAEHNQVIGFKMAMIDNINTVHSTIPNQETDEMLIQSISSMTANTFFNVPSSLKLLTKTMTDTLGAKTVLSSTEMDNVAQVITNVLSNFNTGEYNEDDAQELRDFTANWMNKLRTNSLMNRIPGEAALVLQSRNFDTYLTQTTGCSMIRTPIKTSDTAVQFNFNVLPGTENDPSFGCDKVYNLAYFAFNPNMSSLQNASTQSLTQKSMIAFAITDMNNIPVGLPLTFVTTGADYCPEECGRREDGACRCPDSSTFEIGYVLDKIFNLISKRFWVWFTVPFWADIIPGAWLLITLLIVGCIIPRYSKLESFKDRAYKTRFNAISTAFWVTHPLLSIYAYFDRDLPKTRRAALYFLKVQFLSVMACLLALSSKFTQVGDILLQAWNGSIPAFVLVFLIPYASVYPAMFILSKLLRSYRTKKNVSNDPSSGSQRESETGYDPVSEDAHRSKNSKCVFIFGVLLALALFAGSQAYTWYTAVNQILVEQRNAWAVYLAFAMILDVIVTPLVFMILSYIGASMLAKKTGQKPSFMMRALESVVGTNIIEIRNEPLQKVKVAPKNGDLKNPQLVQVEGKKMDRRVSMGGALPEYYANVQAAGSPEKEVHGANRLGNPLKRQESTESMLNRMHSYSRNGDPLVLMRNGGSIPSLDRLDSNNFAGTYGSKQSLDSLAALDGEDEDRQLIKRGSAPDAKGKKSHANVIRNADGSLALRESQLSGNVDNLMFKVDGESSRGMTPINGTRAGQGKGGVRSLNDVNGGRQGAGYYEDYNSNSRNERLRNGRNPNNMSQAHGTPVYDPVTGLYSTIGQANDMDVQDYRENPNNTSQFSKRSIIPQAVNIQQAGSSLNSRFGRESGLQRRGSIGAIGSMNDEPVVPGKIRSNSKRHTKGMTGVNNSMTDGSYMVEDLNMSHNVDPRYARESMGVNSVNPQGRMMMRDGIARPMAGAMGYQNGAVDPVYGAGNMNTQYNGDTRYNNINGNVNDPEFRGQMGMNMMNNADPRFKMAANGVNGGMMPENYSDNLLNPDGTINPTYVSNADPRYRVAVNGANAQNYADNLNNSQVARTAGRRQSAIDIVDPRSNVAGNMMMTGAGANGAMNPVYVSNADPRFNRDAMGSLNGTPSNRQNRNGLNTSREIELRNIDESRNNAINPLVPRDSTGRVMAPGVIGAGAIDQYNNNSVNGINNKVNGQQVNSMRNGSQDARGNVQNGSTGPTDPNFRVPTGYKNSNDPHLLATAAQQTNTSLIKGDNGIVPQRRGSKDATSLFTRETINATSGVSQAQRNFEQGGVQQRGRTRHVGHHVRQGDNMDNQESFYTMRDTEEFNGTGRNGVLRQGTNAAYGRNSVTPRAAGDNLPNLARFSRDNSMDVGHRMPQDLNASVTICAHCRRASVDASMDMGYDQHNQSILPKNINAQPQYMRNPSMRSHSVNPMQLQEALSIPTRDGFPEEESMDLAGSIQFSRKPSSTNTARGLGFGKVSSTGAAGFRRPLKTDTVVSIGLTPKQAQDAKHNAIPQEVDEEVDKKLNESIDPLEQQVRIEEEMKVDARNSGVSGPVFYPNGSQAKIFKTPSKRQGSVDEMNQQQMLGGKDETWYGQTVEDQLNSSIKGSDFLQRSNNRGNTIRRPNAAVNNNATVLSSRQDVSEFDATINPDLLKEDHLLKSGRKGAYVKRLAQASTDPKRNMKVQTQETSEFPVRQSTADDKNDLIKVKPALSRTLSYADNGFVGDEDDNNKTSNNVLDASKQMRKTFTKTGESVLNDKSRVERYRVSSPTIARSNSKIEMGPKIRMTSMDSKTGFEVKLGKGAQLAKNNKCDHHDAQ